MGFGVDPEGNIGAILGVYQGQDNLLGRYESSSLEDSVHSLILTVRNRDYSTLLIPIKDCYYKGSLLTYKP